MLRATTLQVDNEPSGCLRSPKRTCTCMYMYVVSGHKLSSLSTLTSTFTLVGCRRLVHRKIMHIL